MDVPFFGKLAWLDLTTEKVTIESIDKGIYTKIIGGKGLGAYLLLRNLAPGTDALSPDNLIIIANGPLTGSVFPSSSRVELVTKSPLTGTFLDSNAGGYLGRELKATGLDAIIISGQASKPTYLYIRDSTVEFREAGHLSGLGTTATEMQIKEELKDERSQVISIGPAGENMVLLANVTTGKRHFGRGGAGAVMGSKNLKAVAVRGTNALPWNEDAGFKEIAQTVTRTIRENPLTAKGKVFPTMGTLLTIDVANYFGVFPTRNWQKGTFPEMEGKWPDDFTDRKIKQLSCNRCPISCKRLVKTVKDGEELLHDGPEYESIYALGANCGIHDADTLIMLDNLCTEYGLDSISTGVVISFIMECYEKGIVNGQDLDGLELAFGNGGAMGRLIEKIAHRDGIGELLGRGVRQASREIGEGSASFAMAVKGLELPGYDPRGMKAMALLYATADRGGCHVRGSTLRSELMALKEKVDRFSYDGKAEIVAHLHSEYPLMNSFSICLFANFALTFTEYGQAFNYLYSRDWSLDELRESGTRIWNMTRLFNCREGFNRDHDTLPDRLFNDPLPDGAAKGSVVHREQFGQMLDQYYQIQGWDENGIPREETLQKLGVNDLL